MHWPERSSDQTLEDSKEILHDPDHFPCKFRWQMFHESCFLWMKRWKHLWMAVRRVVNCLWLWFLIKCTVECRFREMARTRKTSWRQQTTFFKSTTIVDFTRWNYIAIRNLKPKLTNGESSRTLSQKKIIATTESMFLERNTVIE